MREVVGVVTLDYVKHCKLDNGVLGNKQEAQTHTHRQDVEM